MPLASCLISTDNLNARAAYLAAVKGNQPTLDDKIQAQFLPIETFTQGNKGHGSTEKRTVEIAKILPSSAVDSTNTRTIIRVQKEREMRDKIAEETCYYISDLTESAFQFAQRIRGYCG